MARPDSKTSNNLLAAFEALNDDLAEYSQLFALHPEP
jgi:hypothetical protein